MPTPDYASGRPVYLQIADDLRARIGSGEYPAGERLPSNKAMSRIYGVAAQTVRQALDVLQGEGLIGTQSTRGTYVLTQHAEPAEQDADVKAALERVEGNLIDLYGKLGYNYPREGAAGEPDSSSKAVGT